MTSTALIIDDEPDIRELLELTLKRMGIASVSAPTKAAALTLLADRSFDLCLTDMRLPDGDGLEIVEWIQQHMAGLPVAVITAHGNVESAVQALKAGAFDFVSKPVDLAGLRKLVDAALRIGGAQDASPPAAPVLLGDSQAMERLRGLAAKVARSQAPVHICGESGTGKELVARMIHETGPRHGAPFVPVNCGAIPTELMESEFFGHRKGSFTGAVADKDGLFQAAEGGTLFLDEVADLPLPMQVKLLRVIQEKSVRPVGAAHELPVDVRILSATHRDLAALVARGTFREDLFYRVNVIELRVPALRERPTDIPTLAAHILTRQARDLGLLPVTLAPDALDRLLAYPFPGNVRELENVLERALTLADGGTIHAEDIVLRTAGAAATDAGTLDDEVDQLQRARIERALEATRWNKTEAAKQLGMTFRQLRYRLKKLGLD
ncbi:MAG: sigma-54 dependent transcriptional regulator [Gammaproteobacteria bacterium]